MTEIKINKVVKNPLGGVTVHFDGLGYEGAEAHIGKDAKTDGRISKIIRPLIEGADVVSIKDHEKEQADNQASKAKDVTKSKIDLVNGKLSEFTDFKITSAEQIKDASAYIRRETQNRQAARFEKLITKTK